MRKFNSLLMGANIVLLALLFYILLNREKGDKGESAGLELIESAVAKRVALTQLQSDFVQAAKDSSKAVVCISVVKKGYLRRVFPFPEDFFEPFLLYPYKEKIPFLGSGFLIDEKGHILTNHHVVEGAEEIFVTLVDGREIKGKVLGADVINDVALLKIEGTNFPFLKVGDSDSLLLGEWVLAIGNPFGKLIEDPNPTVTAGVVSALNRSFKPELESGHVYLNMIQTDAAINPGNSGGPLVNLRGEAVGINTFIVSKTGASHGIGFAIPIKRAMKIYNEIMKYGKIRSLWLDFSCINLSQYLAQLVNAPSLKGALVRGIESGGEAQKVGLKAGDVIIKANDKRIDSASDLIAYIATLQVGDRIVFHLYRNGKEMKISYVVKEYKEPGQTSY